MDLKQQNFSLNRFENLEKNGTGLFLYNFILFANRSSSRYFWFTRWLCLYIHPPLLSKNMLFDEFGDYGNFIPYGGWCWALTNMQVQIVLRQTTSREKPNYLVDLDKNLSKLGDSCWHWESWLIWWDFLPFWLWKSITKIPYCYLYLDINFNFEAISCL